MSDKKKKTQTGIAFRVKNDAAGRALIAEMRKQLNREDFSILLRGRGDRRAAAKREGFKLNCHEDMPLLYADSFAVYVTPKGGRFLTGSELKYHYSLQLENERLERKLATIKAFVVKKSYDR